MHSVPSSLCFLVSISLLLGGCIAEPDGSGPGEHEVTFVARQALGGIAPSLLGMVPADVPVPVDLRNSLGLADPDVVGITVEPGTGQRYILDRFAGIFELDIQGSATLLRAMDELPIPEILPRSLWTDFVAMGDGRFAITALSDGYLLDLEAETLTEYFCYVPGDMPPSQDQLTHSVTFDPHKGLLYAQPITFEQGGLDTPAPFAVSDPLASSVGSYSLEGGQPTAWFNLPDSQFLAGGAAVDRDGTLLLGRDDELFRFDENAATPFEMIDVISEVTSIEGLAVDPERNQLLIIDGPSDRLFTVPLNL